MTSAPSRPQRLSGNNIQRITILGLLIAGMVSCSLFRSTGSGPGSGNTQKPGNDREVQAPTETKAKPKDTVRVSKLDPVKKRIEDSLNRIYPVTVKDRYSVAVMLPLYLEDIDRDRNQKTATTVSQDFYKGLLIAADTLQLCGANLDVHVIDSENPLLSYHSLNDTLDKLNADLMIGPLLEKTRLSFLDSLSRSRKINWVSPLQVADECHGSNYYFESIPAGNITGERTAEMIQKDFPGYRVILINETTTKDNPIAKAFYAQFKIKDSVKVINYAGKAASTYDPGFPLVEKNIIFIPSKNETFVSSVMSKLRVNPQQIVVVGITPWLFFRQQEGDLWEKFNFHISSPFHLDYSDEGLQNFIKEYRSRYNEEPSLWSFIGFDEMAYYGKMLSIHGRYFQRYLLDQPGIPMLHSTYQLKPDSHCAGWKNTYINMLEFENYELKKAD